MARHMAIGTFLKADGEHIAAWRHPNATTRGGVDIDAFINAARIAEEGCLDLIFIGDVAANTDLPAAMLARTSWLDKMEPLTTLTALATVTSRIGLVGTATTTYNEPYPLARRLASIDHVSHGRCGWNLVTTMNHTDALNYGRGEHAALGDRYERAAEFASVLKGLWDSWGDDRFVRDKVAGTYFKPAHLPALKHKGSNFQVRGPLDQARPPQGHPVIVLAGTSEAGRSLAAREADLTFTSQQNKAAAQEFYADMKARVQAAGRAPSDFLILNGLQPVVGRTEAEARAKYEELQSLLDVDMAMAILTAIMGGVDLSPYDPDGPVPDLPPAKGLSSRRDMLVALARRENLSLKQLALRMAGARGHLTVIGTPQRIADEMQAWFADGAVDGFLLLPPINPDSLSDFVDLVLPELRRRGLFRTAYAGATLRDHLGLKRPVPSQHG